MKKIRFPARDARRIEDDWQRLATDAAISAARNVLIDGAVPPMTPVSRLSDVEWGWIVSAILFGWIKTRAEQATHEGRSVELALRVTGTEPEPWDAGAVASILPELGRLHGIDWNTSLSHWTRETMVEFLTIAFKRIGRAIVARDEGGGAITRKATNPAAVGREANAAAGGPLMMSDELVDPLM